MCIICSVRSGQEVLPLTWGVRCKFVSGYFGFMLVYVSGFMR